MVEREDQLKSALNILLCDETSRIAILGGGGFGKTTLARTILHHHKVAERYKLRYFLSCEALTDVETLLLGIGSMLYIKASPNAMLASIRHKLETSTTLLCLDNFETPWEPSATRTKIEDFLASIADIPNLSLIITTRGTQRPSKVAWSHPFLPPLSTVSPNGARAILKIICPDHEIDEPTQNLLDAVDGIPLAITLISNLLRDGETSRALWTRWLKEQTKIIENGGDDRESNLDASIALSIHSPRMKKDPGAIALLTALSLLPDGFPSASIEQLAEYLGLTNIHKALQTLRAVALIKPDESNDTSPQIQMLSPIRIFCVTFLSSEISLALEKVVDYYISIMLQAQNKYGDGQLYAQVIPEIQNMHSVFQRVYKVGYLRDISRLINATSYLTNWSDYIGYLAQDTIQMALKNSVNFPIPHANCLVSLGDLYNTEGQHERAEIYYRDASTLFHHENDIIGEARAVKRCGDMLFYMGKFDKAEVSLEAALELYTQNDNKHGQADACLTLGRVYNDKTLYSKADATLTGALEAYKQIGNLIGQANAAGELSDLHFDKGNLVKAKEYATESLDAAKQTHDRVGEGNALHSLGKIYLALDQVPDARQAFEQALLIAKQQNESINQLISISNLAKVYIQSDQLSAAEALLTASAKIELDVMQIPIILTTLAWLYICADRFDKAEPLLDDALQRFRKFDYKGWQAEVLGYLGTIYLKSDRLDDAERALISIPNLDPWRSITIQQFWVLGDLYIIKGELKDAEASLNAAMALCQNHGWSWSYQQGNIVRSMGTLHMKRGCVDQAIQAFKRAREFHRKAQWVSEQATDLKQLGEAYKMLERTEEAEAAYKEAEELMESVREARTLKD